MHMSSFCWIPGLFPAHAGSCAGLGSSPVIWNWQPGVTLSTGMHVPGTLLLIAHIHPVRCHLCRRMHASFLCPAAAAAVTKMQAAVELCGIVLDVAAANNLTSESIDQDRRTQRSMLDWPYSEAVPDGQPKPAENQACRYRDIAIGRLADAMLSAEQRNAADQDRDMLRSAPARWHGDGPLHAIASHPSLQYLKGWLPAQGGRCIWPCSCCPLLHCCCCTPAAALQLPAAERPVSDVLERA